MMRDKDFDENILKAKNGVNTKFLPPCTLKVLEEFNISPRGFGEAKALDECKESFDLIKARLQEVVT